MSLTPVATKPTLQKQLVHNTDQFYLENPGSIRKENGEYDSIMKAATSASKRGERHIIMPGFISEENIELLRVGGLKVVQKRTHVLGGCMCDPGEYCNFNITTVSW